MEDQSHSLIFNLTLLSNNVPFCYDIIDMLYVYVCSCSILVIATLKQSTETGWVTATTADNRCIMDVCNKKFATFTNSCQLYNDK